jgi:hypothetical protein
MARRNFWHDRIKELEAEVRKLKSELNHRSGLVKLYSALIDSHLERKERRTQPPRWDTRGNVIHLFPNEER